MNRVGVCGISGGYLAVVFLVYLFNTAHPSFGLRFRSILELNEIFSCELSRKRCSAVRYLG